jgi:nucleoside-diphosphate-sugar epimerase
LVYGPGAKGNFAALLRLCRLAPPLPLGRLANRRSLIYVGNLTDAIALCLAHPKAAGGTYLVRDGDDATMTELIRLITRALGRKPKLIPVPPGILRLGLGLAGKSDAAARLLGSLRINDEKIRADLGWNPPFTMLQGLSETARWFLSRPGENGAGSGEQSQLVERPPDP